MSHYLEEHHLLYDSGAGKLCGVTDWGDVNIGSTFGDYAGIWYCLGPKICEKVLALNDKPVTGDVLDTLYYFGVSLYIFTLAYGVEAGKPWHRQMGTTGLERIL